jgi:tripartite-type tricarboxylate transporter receptor subunit TctC
MPMPVSLTRRAALAAAAFAAPSLARAQGAWPSRPIRMVVAWPPGGGADVPARLVAGPMQRILGQPVVVENRGGASGSIGAGVVAQAAPDGYTVLADTSPIISNSLLMHNLGYDSATAFAPVTQVVLSPLMLVVRPDYPARNLAELIERARETPGGMIYASSGTAAGILGGDAVFTFSTLPQATPLVRDGRLRALAVATAERLEALPEVPTVAEQGFPGFSLSEFLAFWVPAGTPPEAISRLQTASTEALREPEVRQRLAQIGMIPVGSSTADFAAFVAEQRKSLAELIAAENIRLE